MAARCSLALGTLCLHAKGVTTVWFGCSDGWASAYYVNHVLLAVHPAAYCCATLAADAGEAVAGLGVARAMQPFEPGACERGRGMREREREEWSVPAFSTDDVDHVGKL